MNVMAPLVALHITRHPMAVQRLLTPSITLVLNYLTPKGWKDESSSRVLRPGVEPGPLASEASVLRLDHLLSVFILNRSKIYYVDNNVHKYVLITLVLCYIVLPFATSLFACCNILGFDRRRHQ